MKARHSVKEAYAVYTGGNIWLFYGTTKSGNYFLTDDNGSTLILNADPSNLDESLYEDWQFEHYIEELIYDEREKFCDEIIQFLEIAGDIDHLLEYAGGEDYRGGITNGELEAYKTYFKEPF